MKAIGASEKFQKVKMGRVVAFQKFQKVKMDQVVAIMNDWPGFLQQ
jgi:hypothetical protein